MHMYLQRNILVNYADLKPNMEVTSGDFDMPKYKQDILRLDQREHYLRHRDTSFDFVYMAEQESL